MKYLKLFLKSLLWIIGTYVLIWLTFTTLTDNQISSYVKSNIFNYPTKYHKIIELSSPKSLDSLFKNNPNSEFYFMTLYCGYCTNKLMNGYDYDSAMHKKIIYINVDNSQALKKISDIIENNKNISKIYYLNDNHFSGMYHIKGWNIVDTYLPRYKGNRNYFPFTLVTDSLGKIVQLK